jgi:hypothetical protein
MQLDYYLYEYDLRKRVIPEGQRRAHGSHRHPLAGRSALAAATT